MINLITIYQFGSNNVRAVVEPDDSSNQSIGIMRGDTVSLSFSSPTFIDFQIGDYCNIYGTLYTLNVSGKWSKAGKRNFSFSLTLEGPYHQLSKVQFLALSPNNNFTQGKFSFTGRPVDFIDLIIANMNRAFPTDNWLKGLVIDGNFETLDFDGENCLQALSKLAQKFSTEFLISGNKVSLIQTQTGSGITLEYGKGKALWNVSRENHDDSTSIITRLYVYGSDKNLGDSYRFGAPRLRMASGLYLEKNVDRYGLFEGTVVFDGSNDLQEIKPERTGLVTAVTANNTFTDTGIDFDVNGVLMPGVTAKLTFNSGLLAGIIFEINSFNYSTKTFVINPNTDSQTVTLPRDDIKPAVGDKYVLTDIIMPLSYINDAEERLRVAGQKYLDKKATAADQFNVGCNPLYFRDSGLQLTPGLSFNLVVADANVNRSIRLIGFTRSLRNRFIYSSLTLADSIEPQSPLVKLLNSIK